MNTDGTVKSHQKISDTQGDFTGVLDDTDLFGVSVVALGDLDEDGMLDLAVGTSEADDGGNGRGGAWILFLDTPADLTLTKTVNDPAPLPGQLITYTVTISNDSLSVTATNVVISDTLPAGLTFAGPVTLTPSQPGAVLATQPGDLPTLASGLTILNSDQVTLTFPVLVNNEGTEGLVIDNTATVTSTGNVNPLGDSVSIRVLTVSPEEWQLYLPLILFPRERIGTIPQ